MLRFELAQVAAAWPLGVSMAAAMVARELVAGRRREALNEAVHEVRRPLQALALAAPAPRSPASGSLQLAATALERLEREINGEPSTPMRVAVDVEALLRAAVARWRPRAQLGGGSLALAAPRPGAVLSGDRCRLAQALDNLIVNAIEHGGPEIAVAARATPERLTIVVADAGGRPRGQRRGRGPWGRLGGRRRHGHGLRVVRRVAAEHGGRFRLRHLPHGTEAVLELPSIESAGDEQAG